MDLTPVESSHIAAAGYSQPDRILLIRFKDGSVYARIDVTPEQAADFFDSQSKGRNLQAMPNKAVFITKGVMPTDGIQSAVSVNAGGGNEGAPPPVLNSIDEDANKCCQRRLTLRLSTLGGDIVEQLPLLQCKDCGTEFKPEMVGPVRHWRIVPFVAVLTRK